jgi:hypothetical protein
VRPRFSWPQLWPKAYASGAMLHDQNSTVLSQLRELRATLAGHTARLERVEGHVDRIDGQLRDIHLLVARALEPAPASRPRIPGEDGPEANATCQRHSGCPGGHPGDPPEDPLQGGRGGSLEERVSDIEHRLARVEERLDG